LWRYLAVVVLFALGLMAKPMLVTLPFVLLLLDYWPLGRVTGALRTPSAVGCVKRTDRADSNAFHALCETGPAVNRRATAHRVYPLLLEKVPLLLLGAASCMTAILAQSKAGAVTQLEVLPLSARAANALVSYLTYLCMFFYPTGLAAYYPHPISLPIWKVVAASIMLATISAGAIATARRFPYFLVGWFWYLGMLVPVVGLVQVGTQALADRYTYLPGIGLCIALAWAAAQFSTAWTYRSWAGGIVSALVLAALMVCAWRQTSLWRNSETLWTHALSCTSRNALAHYSLATDLADRGRMDEAIAHFQEALRIEPGRAQTHNNFGNVLALRGRVEEAIAEYEKAVAIKPDYANAHSNLSIVLFRCGRIGDAEAHCRKALEADPERIDARYNLALLLLRSGRVAEALAQLREVLRLRPNDVGLLNDTAWVLATDPNASIRDGRQAVEFAERAAKLSAGQDPAILGTLAAAYAERGQFPQAVQTAGKALDLATQQGSPNLAKSIQAKIRLYKAGTPFRDRTSGR
jgi:tetratricopeptide (TPR) repeat protein